MDKDSKMMRGDNYPRFGVIDWILRGIGQVVF